MTFARIRALVIVGVLVVAATVVVVIALLNDRQKDSNLTGGCPNDAVIADLRLPQEKDVKIKLYNASGGVVSTGSFANTLAHRGFQVSTANPGEEPQAPLSEVAVVRYGPKAVGKAWVVQAYFINDVTPEFQIKRPDDVVDVVIGSGFKKLATVSEVKQALWQVGRPLAPPGTCARD
jgi:hypothetical protein